MSNRLMKAKLAKTRAKTQKLEEQQHRRRESPPTTPASPIQSIEDVAQMDAPEMHCATGSLPDKQVDFGDNLPVAEQYGSDGGDDVSRGVAIGPPASYIPSKPVEEAEQPVLVADLPTPSLDDIQVSYQIGLVATAQGKQSYTDTKLYSSPETDPAIHHSLKRRLSDSSTHTNDKRLPFDLKQYSAQPQPQPSLASPIQFGYRMDPSPFLPALRDTGSATSGVRGALENLLNSDTTFEHWLEDDALQTITPIPNNDDDDAIKRVMKRPKLTPTAGHSTSLYQSFDIASTSAADCPAARQETQGSNSSDRSTQFTHLLQLTRKALRCVPQEDSRLEASFESGAGLCDMDKSTIMLRLHLGAILGHILDMKSVGDKRSTNAQELGSMQPAQTPCKPDLATKASSIASHVSKSTFEEDLGGLNDCTDISEADYIGDSACTNSQRSKGPQMRYGQRCPWTDVEEKRLMAYMKEELDRDLIAEKLGRSWTAIQQHWRLMKRGLGVRPDHHQYLLASERT